MLGLRCCARAFSSCSERGPLFIAVRGPLTIAASLVAEHRLQTRRLSSCGSRAQLPRGMWDLPRPGLEPMSPALAGRLPTTAPPGKPPRENILRVGATNACLQVTAKNLKGGKGRRYSRKKAHQWKSPSENKKGMTSRTYMEGPVFDWGEFSMPWMGIRRDKSGMRYVYGYGGDKIKEVFSNAFSFLQCLQFSLWKCKLQPQWETLHIYQIGREKRDESHATVVSWKTLAFLHTDGGSANWSNLCGEQPNNIYQKWKWHTIWPTQNISRNLSYRYTNTYAKWCWYKCIPCSIICNNKLLEIT